MSAHTPGPWTLLVDVSDGQHGGSFEVSTKTPEGVIVICDRAGIPHRKDESIANARLIAAAPELLEAARSALGTLEALVGGGPVEHPDIPRLRAAIAKAGGK